jgi:hypothetical protein
MICAADRGLVTQRKPATQEFLDGKMGAGGKALNS